MISQLNYMIYLLFIARLLFLVFTILQWNMALLSGQSGFQISVFLHSFGLQTLPSYVLTIC